MSPLSTYNELQITASSHLEFLSDFILSCGIDAIEEQENKLIIRSEEELDNLIWGLEEFVKKLQESVGKDIAFTYTQEQKSNQDWVQKYQQSVQPIEVGSFYIHPSWVEEKQNLLNITIDPALAFGSGHHESTNSCLLALEKYVKKDDSVLDLGCGSGILSIACAKLGACVDACDTDEQATEATKQNTELNAVSLNSIWTGSVGDAPKTYSVIVANIIADVLVMLSSEIQEKLNSDGVLILSGILEKYEDKILKTFSQLDAQEIIAKNEWRTIILKKGKT